MNQTFTDYEIVVVDDGSQDESASIAETVLASSVVKCRMIRQKNAGVSMARNKGVACSEGTYLCFLDADDWWAPTFLAEMSSLIDEYPEAGIYGTSYIIVNETKHKTRVAPVGVETGFTKGYINYCQVYAKTLIMPLTSISVTIPRCIFEEMQGFPEGIKLGEDFLLWIKIALKYKVAFLNKPLAFYNQDVDTRWRAVGHLHEPNSHMLWNLGSFERYERSNLDYKRLIDALRTHSLLPYYLSQQYREDAEQELAKVDWQDQPRRIQSCYNKPIWFLKVAQRLKRIGSIIKQCIIKSVIRPH